MSQEGLDHENFACQERSCPNVWTAALQRRPEKDTGSEALSEPFPPGEKHDRGSAGDGLGARGRATLFRVLPAIFSAWA